MIKTIEIFMSKLSAYKKMINYDFSFKKTLGKTAKNFTPHRKDDQLLSSFKEADVVVLGLEKIIASCDNTDELKAKIQNINWNHDVVLVEDYNNDLMTASQTVFISPFRSIIRSKNKVALNLIPEDVIEERLTVELGEKLLLDILSCDHEEFVFKVAPILKKIMKHPPYSLNITSLLIELDSNQVGLSSVVNMHNILKDVVKASFTATPISPTTTTFMLKSKVGVETNYYSVKEKHFFDYLDSSLPNAVSYLEKRAANISSPDVAKELYSGLSNRLYNKSSSFFESKNFYLIQDKIIEIIKNINTYDLSKTFADACQLKLLCRKFNELESPHHDWRAVSSFAFGQFIYLNVVDKSLLPSQIEGLVPYFKAMQIESSSLYLKVFYELFQKSQKDIFDSPESRKVRKGEVSIEDLVLKKMDGFLSEIPLDFNMFVDFFRKDSSFKNMSEQEKIKNLLFLEKLSDSYFKNKITTNVVQPENKPRF